MLISMTPNDEVKTIHASLNDGSMRKWEFEPYIEQGKIELTDQDYATIQSIKGNTVKFNQYCPIPDSSLNIISLGGTVSFSNNYVSLLYDGTTTGAIIIYGNFGIYNDIANSFNGHKILFMHEARGHGTFASYTYRINIKEWTTTDLGNNVWKKFSQIITYNSANENGLYFYVNQLSGVSSGNPAFDVRNIMVIDLSQIFGVGNEPTSVSDFETWLSNNIGLLPYYDYTPGTLIPFKGTGLKTTGKNLFDYDDLEVGGIDNNTGLNLDNPTHRRLVNYIYTGTFKTFSISGVATGEYLRVFEYDGNKNYIKSTLFNNQTITVSSNCAYIRISGNATGYTTQLQIEIGNVSSSFEPYTESTLSLPISLYFPTGMKEAGTVYDEISDKAYTRVGSVDLGSLTWSYSTGSQNPDAHIFYANNLPNRAKAISADTIANLISSIYKTDTVNRLYRGTADNMSVAVSGDNIYVRNDSFTDATSFKNAMSGVMLYYELATPTSQEISLDLTYPIWNGGTEQILPVNGSTPTTSPMVATIKYPDRTEDVNFLYKQTTFDSAIPQFSLVCKNQELPMTLNDGKLIFECDSSITNESGFFDCKVKMQDLESVAYSQKIQLHVERGIND